MERFVLYCIFLAMSSLAFFSTISFSSSDTLTSTQSLRINETLVSSGKIFELGFFNSSSRFYLGIWYHQIPHRTIIWVANRDTPLENSNSSASLRIGNSGNLVLLDGSRNPVWSSSSNQSKIENPVLQILDSGNLVLKDANDRNGSAFRWQSFDSPTDTLLPGMKLGWNLDSGIEWRLTSWKTQNDPSSGDVSYRLDPNGIPEVFLYDNGVKSFRTGSWNGVRFGGIVQDSHEVYYTPSSTLNNNESVHTRLVVNSTGQLQRYVWTQSGQSWSLQWSAPKDQCDSYYSCGPYGLCDANAFPVCNCLKGFKPKDQNEWDLRDFSGGCVRNDNGLEECEKDKFLRVQHVALPDTTGVYVNKTMSLLECESMCVRNCSCSGYGNVEISNAKDGKGNGCVIWSEELKDMRQFSEGGQDVYVRVAASFVAGDDSGSKSSGRSGKKKHVVGMIVGIIVGGALIIVLVVTLLLIRKKKKKKSQNVPKRKQQIDAYGRSPDRLLFSSNTEYNSGDRNMDDLELPLFDFNTISMATNNFSDANELGQGGFGSVYRGGLNEGQEIAVKRLSEGSQQGIEEFKNEIRLIAKLQHRNLVRIFGCCIEKDEKMLIYEYMENKSLDFFLFDQERRSLLDWKLRFNIISGIARGLLYLHQDSRLRIIHRDLKASNILLDKEMNPKISDFGMARIFCTNQTEANTRKIVGTYGYMSPEYALDGLFSTKSDIYSFGVLVLEIVSGKKNRGFSYADELNLLGHAWRLWNEGRALELVDSSFGDSYSSSEALRCIQIGLICVEERPEDRPTMTSVVMMLNNIGESTSLIAEPRNPGFTLTRSPIDSSPNPQEDSVNQVTLTGVVAR